MTKLLKIPITARAGSGAASSCIDTLGGESMTCTRKLLGSYRAGKAHGQQCRCYYKRVKSRNYCVPLHGTTSPLLAKPHVLHAPTVVIRILRIPRIIRQGTQII